MNERYEQYESLEKLLVEQTTNRNQGVILNYPQKVHTHTNTYTELVRLQQSKFLGTFNKITK